MITKKLILASVFAAVLGFILGVAGIRFTDYRYWVVFLPANLIFLIALI